MRILLLLLLSQALCAQLLHFGAKAGAPLSDAVDSVSGGGFDLTAATRRFTIGPSAEIRFPMGLAVEADLLYKRTNLDLKEGETATSRGANSFEIPVLVKYRLPGDHLRPFLGGGASFRRFSDLKDFASGVKPNTWGGVLLGGLELRIGGVSILPEVRYTRWSSGSSGDSGGLRYNQNQAEFLVGILF
ncbi:MAG: PorT family protein [bacterium]|nr:PorT family protein [bacterium]